MSHPFLRLFLLATACTMAGAIVSCDTETVGPDGNIFLRRSPRYGHGGTERPKYKYGATGDGTGEPGTTGHRDTQYLSGTGERIHRDDGAASDGADNGSDNSSPDTGGRPSSPDNGGVADAGSSTDPPAESKPKPKPASEDLPYATPVPGKDGFVYSPYYSAGYVDVSGMPSGSKARCPYTKKIFRVP